MRTDKQIYAIFAARPQWLFEIAGLASPGRCQMKSVTHKEIERRSDGVVFPDDPTEKLTVIEFQLHDDPTIYCRTAIEMALLQQEHSMRGVQGIIFFRSVDADPQTEPWRHVIRSIPLRETMAELAIRDPNHPLVAVFQPVLSSDEDALAQRAAEYYNQIKGSELDPGVKSTLLDVFVNWLEQRFGDKGKQEIENMLLGELPDLRETQSGKDLIEIGRQEGEIEGEIKGEREALIWVIEAKFGEPPPEVQERVARIDSVDKLKELLVQVVRVDALDGLQW